MTEMKRHDMEIPTEVERQLREQRELVMSSESGEVVRNTAWRAIDFLLDSVLELERLEV